MFLSIFFEDLLLVLHTAAKRAGELARIWRVRRTTDCTHTQKRHFEQPKAAQNLLNRKGNRTIALILAENGFVPRRQCIVTKKK